MNPLRATLIAVLVVLSGCATVVREHRLRDHLTRFVYEKPIDALWADARAFAAEQGFIILGEERREGIRVFKTDWKGQDEASDMAAHWTRLLILARPVAKDRSVLHIYAAHKTAGGNTYWGSMVASSWSGLPGPFALQADNMSGVPGQFLKSVGKQSSGFRRAAAGQSSAGRDFKLEHAFIRRAVPEQAQELEDALR